MAAQEPLAAMACNQPWKLRHLDLMDHNCRPNEDVLLPMLQQQSHLTHLSICGSCEWLHCDHQMYAVSIGCLTDRFAVFTLQLGFSPMIVSLLHCLSKSIGIEPVKSEVQNRKLHLVRCILGCEFRVWAVVCLAAALLQARNQGFRVVTGDCPRPTAVDTCFLCWPCRLAASMAQNLTQLSELLAAAGRTAFSEAGAALLARLPRLRHLDLETVTAAHAAALMRAVPPSSLTHLRLTGCPDLHCVESDGKVLLCACALRAPCGSAVPATHPSRLTCVFHDQPAACRRTAHTCPTSTAII